MLSKLLSRFIPFLLILSMGILGASCSRAPVSLAPAEETAVAFLALTQFARTTSAEQTGTAESLALLNGTPTPAGATPTPTATIPPTVLNTPREPGPTAETAPDPTPTSTPRIITPSPTAAPSPTPTPNIVFQDDFEATRGWYTFESERFQMKYQRGGYVIYNNVLGAEVTSIRTQNHADAHIEVDAARLSGPQNAFFGLVCRYQDDANYYALVIGSDGFHGIALMKGGVLAFISPPANPTSAIKGGFAENRISATCHSHNFTLFVNGEKLLQVKDTTFSTGYVGLIVGTTSAAGVEVVFDNFQVSK
jgi:hypothetical protein